MFKYGIIYVDSGSAKIYQAYSHVLFKTGEVVQESRRQQRVRVVSAVPEDGRLPGNAIMLSPVVDTSDMYWGYAQALWDDMRRRLGLRASVLPRDRSDFYNLAKEKLYATAYGG